MTLEYIHPFLILNQPTLIQNVSDPLWFAKREEIVSANRGPTCQGISAARGMPALNLLLALPWNFEANLFLDAPRSGTATITLEACCLDHGRLRGSIPHKLTIEK